MVQRWFLRAIKRDSAIMHPFFRMSILVEDSTENEQFFANNYFPRHLHIGWFHLYWFVLEVWKNQIFFNFFDGYLPRNFTPFRHSALSWG
jgi:hypothetical protein